MPVQEKKRRVTIISQAISMGCRTIPTSCRMVETIRQLTETICRVIDTKPLPITMKKGFLPVKSNRFVTGWPLLEKECVTKRI